MKQSQKMYYFMLLIILALGIILLSYNIYIGIAAIAAAVVLVSISEGQKYREMGRQEEYQSITREVAKINRDKMYELPIPMAVVSETGTSMIINRAFMRTFGSKISKTGTNLFESFHINPKNKIEGTIHQIHFQKKDYAMLVSGFMKRQKRMFLLHFVDITEQKAMEARSHHRETLFCYIVIDNYDDISEQLPANERSLILSKIDVILADWAERNEAVLIKYDNDHYLALFTRKNLEVMQRDHFHILDEVREVAANVSTPVTLSLGIGFSEEAETLQDADSLSRAALDIALARGGDQCVVREDDKNAYYGGKTEAKEKRTKVKARVKAQGLKELISDADNVLIMGHQNPDMDCLGAAVGLLGACRRMGVDARFILQEINGSISALIDYLSQNEEYAESFIKPKEIENFFGNGTLLIIVDTQSSDFVEVPELLEKTDNIVVIDHHRASGKSISGRVFSYLEAYASSTCELVTELLQYFDIKDIIGKVEANALLAGMYMDTKMFTVKTGVRTFEAASNLRRKGGDTVIARTMLQDDLKTYTAKFQAVTKAGYYYDNTIAVAFLENDDEDANLIAAQAADELLNIRGIKASFIVTKTNDRGILISGRSIGSVNVQMILEKLGGGGHMTMAGAQLKDVDDLEEAKAKLFEAIDSYKKESEEE